MQATETHAWIFVFEVLTFIRYRGSIHANEPLFSDFLDRLLCDLDNSMVLYPDTFPAVVASSSIGGLGGLGGIGGLGGSKGFHVA